jgi:hypothetical protein
MGILTEFLAATPDEALALAETGPVNSGLVSAELKSVHSVLLGMLWAAVRDGSIEAYQLDVHDPLLGLASGSDEGPWLSQVRDECRSDLASLPDDRVLPVAQDWTRAEEWSGSPQPEALIGFVGAIRDVARAATEPGRHMYMWMSL